MSLDGNLDAKIKSLEALESYRGLSLQELGNTFNKIHFIQFTEEHHASLTSKINHLSNKISDLAFSNYRTYANAGRTAEQAIEMASLLKNNP
jgi:hypothetical protein